MVIDDVDAETVSPSATEQETALTSVVLVVPPSSGSSLPQEANDKLSKGNRNAVNRVASF
jgi:hypothetical protein